MKDIVLMLDNIRSVHNVGSIFRTAETAGVSKVYCLGTTPTPLDRFSQKRKDFAKVALGAEDLVSWEYLESGESLIRRLKKDGFQIVALEQDQNSINFKKIKLGKNVALIVGNEVGGVSKSLLKLVDEIAEIPMKGKKESLNVSVATGIMLFELI
jgi:23S rRNA (guanosine2251-2'-O)-methyltransferase